jgi:hypothetical protein
VAVVPEPPTFEIGASDTTALNLLRDSIRFLQAPPVAELRQTAAQTFTTGVTTAVQFNAEDVDSDIDAIGGHDNVTNNTRYTARYPGWYVVSGAVVFAANVTGDRFAWFMVNGSDVNGSLGFVAGDATGTASTPARTKHVFLNVGDYVELVGFQNSGGNLLTSGTGREQSSMSVRWVSS